MRKVTKQWEVTNVYDRGRDNLERCECCHARMVRYAHVVEAEDGEVLEVGCVCVNFMVPGYDGTEAERPLRNRATAMANFNKKWAGAGGILIAKRGEYTATITTIHHLSRLEISQFPVRSWRPEIVFEERRILSVDRAKAVATAWLFSH